MAIIVPNEGKLFIGQNAISGFSAFAGLIKTKSVALGTIIAASTMAGGIGEIAGTGYARVAVAVPTMNGSGVMTPMPAITFDSGAATDWPTDVLAFFIASLSGIGTGKVLLVQDLSTVRDMSKAQSHLVIPAGWDWFFRNPGE